jgi:hypothetical protein
MNSYFKRLVNRFAGRLWSTWMMALQQSTKG